MGRVITLRDDQRLEAVLRRDPSRHLYALGDLDPFFRPHAHYQGLERDGDIAAVMMTYRATEPPVLLIFGADQQATAELLGEMAESLPDQAYAHVEPCFLPTLEQIFELEELGRDVRMMLRDPDAVCAAEPTCPIEQLGPEHLDEAQQLYMRAYPGNWFDPRMLETRRYFAVREEGKLVAIAGVHVFSARLGVAALGNIATDPACRGRGLGRAVTSALCRALLTDADVIGLNVNADNTAAIRLYERLGFVAEVELAEVLATRAARTVAAACRAT